MMAIRKKERFQGRLIWYYLLFYSAMRFSVEFLRDDPRGWFFPQVLSTSQAIAVPTAALALFMILRRKSPSPSAPAQKK